jgi:hypothetical protein
MIVLQVSSFKRKASFVCFQAFVIVTIANTAISICAHNVNESSIP